MNRLHRPDHRSAFTLVEVLAVLVLVAIILPVAMRAISVSTAMAGEARHRVEAVTLAEATLCELATGNAWQDSELSGDFGEDWPGYRWDAEVSDWDGNTLQQLTLSVAWTSRGVERSVTLSTLVSTGSP